jgi:hypothetical protein
MQRRIWHSSSEVLSQREQLCRSQSCSSVCHVSRKGCRFPCPQRRCLRETAPGVTGLRTDGIILLADEDCSKDLLVDSFGCNPTLVSSFATSSNFLFDNVFAAMKNAKCLPVINPSCAMFIPIGFTVFGSFSQELRAVFDRFARTIFEQEHDSFCRPLVQNVSVNVCCMCH